MGTTTYTFVLWLMLFVYALHILEEQTLYRSALVMA